MARFYLGTHMANWLDQTDVPLFVSHRRLWDRRTFPRALGPWALDSGGFTELSMHGGWQTTPADYLAAVARYRDEIGNLEWAAPQDWMCEPHMLARTGLRVADHQRRTVDNFLELRSSEPLVVPVLQGWTRDHYMQCVDLYDRAGVDLTAEPRVGLGSVCRRHNTGMVADLVRELYDNGIRCHAFGLKTDGWHQCSGWLASADSMAWSFRARRSPAIYGHKHKSCANCLSFALRWRTKHIGQAWQPTLEAA